MKNMTRHLTLLSLLLTLMLFVNSAFTTKNSGLREFKIEFESTKNGLKLTGAKGTAFKELSFTLRDNIQQGVDAFGMTIQDARKNADDDNLANFEFTIEKVDNEYVLVSKRGTAWTRLSFTFSPNNKAIVDQNGVTVK